MLVSHWLWFIPMQWLFPIGHSLHPHIFFWSCLCISIFLVVTLLILSTTKWNCQLHSPGSLLVKAILNSVQTIDKCIYPTPLHKQDVTQGQFFKSFNSKFSFSLTVCHTKAKEPNLPYNLIITGERRVHHIYFSRVLVISEMQTALSRLACKNPIF